MLLNEGRRCRLAGIAMLGLVAFAAGCRGSGNEALESAKPPPAEPKISQSELIAFCPPVGLREGTAFFTSYERPAAASRRQAAETEADAAAPQALAGRVIYQTAITDVTRSCTRANGTLTMTVGVAGRVVPGPAARPGSVALPIRIAVVNGPEVLFTQLFQYNAQVASTTSASQFIFTTSAVSFPDTGARSVRAYAGFDEGPPKTAQN